MKTVSFETSAGLKIDFEPEFLQLLDQVEAGLNSEEPNSLTDSALPLAAAAFSCYWQKYHQDATPPIDAAKELVGLILLGLTLGEWIKSEGYTPLIEETEPPIEMVKGLVTKIVGELVQKRILFDQEVVKQREKELEAVRNHFESQFGLEGKLEGVALEDLANAVETALAQPAKRDD